MTPRRTFLVRSAAMVSGGATQLLFSACGGGGDAGAAAPSGETPSPSEQQLGSGLILQTGDEQASLPTTYGAPLGGNLPSSFDLPLDLLPPVGHQARSQSCATWAIGYAAATFMLAKKTGIKPSAASRQVSPKHLWGHIGAIQGNDCSKGTRLKTVLDTMKLRPVGFENQYPSSNLGIVCPARSDISSGVLVTGSAQVTDTSIASIQSHLVHHGHPMPIGLILSKNDMDAYRGGIYKSVASGGNIFGHAMCIVGFDNSRNAWKIMNSWGTAWGERGFMWFHYEALANSGQVSRTIPEIHYISGVERAVESEPRVGVDIKFQTLQVVHQIAQTNADILYFNFSLNEWIQITHVAYSYSDGVNQSITTDWKRFSLYAKTGYVYFATPGGYRWVAGTYSLHIYGTDRAGVPVQISTSSTLE